ncbi:hypothetical protein C8Q70DRAFT_282742 [Cubamyces menziesii]|nr:hypothetical protein C8Q70DRAFT_282742 [Cubamyces menziesii]
MTDRSGRLSSPDRGYAHKIESDDRPSKRRRLSPELPARSSPSAQQIILEEIDLEVAIRRRIADTVQSRITWALLLQESLKKSVGSRSEDFRSASLDALDAIEAPCDLIFDREVRLAPQPIRPPPNPASTNATPAEAPAPPAPFSRSTRTRGLPRAAPAPRERLLYIRNTATDPPEVAKLACSVCARSDFSSLQGLLNHCRLRHQIEYGSHDECMQSCAVLVPENERDWVVACGIEVGGVSLPSLRRLFEIAVGAGDDVILPTRKPSPATAVPTPTEGTATELPPLAPAEEGEEKTPQEVPSSAHVTKTLGYHIDTPALAPFLGRAPKKRCINVRANEDDPVDIEDLSGGSGLHKRHVWRKPYAHRNVARKELDEIVPLSELPGNVPTSQEGSEEADAKGQETGQGEKDRSALQMLSGTRFHINARVQIADYSLFIPPNQRPADHPDHTHRWRLVVTSPSYSLPISSILRKVTITCASDPPLSTLVEPLTISEPPFVVTSTADRPFLARLTFSWAGTKNPSTEIEHWVELDPMHYANPILGDEQVFDVELDRSTELLPVRADIQEVPLEDMHSAETSTSEAVGAAEKEEVAAEPDYAVRLRSLVPQFPMTLKDVKGRFSSRLPYTLVNTPAQLRNMHYGRRKALEMARARALRDAYSQLVSQEKQGEGQEASVPLSTVDVYRWLEDEGFYPRSESIGTTPGWEKQQRHGKLSSRRHRGPGALAEDAFCHTCGLHRAYHPNVVDEDVKPVDIKPAALGAAVERRLCMAFNGEPARRPIFDVDALLSFSDRPASDTSGAEAAAVQVPYGLSRAIFVAPAAASTSSTSSGSAANSISQARQSQILSSSSAPDLVSVADPRLVVAIWRMTALPFLRNAPRYGDDDHNHDHDHDNDHDEEEDPARAATSLLTTLPRTAAAAHLAPSALLAVSLKAFVRQLVGRGIDTLRRDEAALRVATGRHERARRATAAAGGSAQSERPRRVLAPAHVLRGVAAHARTGTTGSALRVCLARLGERSAATTARRPTDGTVHIGAQAARGGEGGSEAEAGRAEGEVGLLRGPATKVPERVVVKAEEE